MADTKRLKLSGGKSGQKPEIRHGLMEAALEIVERGDKLTIAAAAKHAGISTGTAYRYFADPSALIIDAIQEQQIHVRCDIFDDLRQQFELMDDVEERVLLVHRVIFDLTRRHETASRLLLAKRLESRPDSKERIIDLRNIRRMKMYEMALAPLEERIGSKSVSDLVSALSAASGLESYTVLKDLCFLSDDEIDRITCFNLRAILRAAIPATSETC